MSGLCTWNDRAGDCLITPFRYCQKGWTEVCGDSDASLAYRISIIVFLALATIVSSLLAVVGCSIKFCAEQIQPAPAPWTSPFIQDRIKNEYEELEKLVVKDVWLNSEFSVGAKLTRRDDNLNRNRYEDILPNNATRFLHSGDKQFYFNANWILNGKILASQGPLDKEIAQFWEMIWDAKIGCIVKLANEVEREKDKCAFYCGQPGSQSSVFDKFTVTRIKSSDTSAATDKPRLMHYAFDLQKGTEKKRTIHQFALENWPDHGLISPQLLAQLVRTVYKRMQSEPGPILVHCSAGIGRAGAFAATYEAYDLYQQGNRSTNLIYGIVAHMRGLKTGRNGMVQTEEQYELIHKAAKELITSQG